MSGVSPERRIDVTLARLADIEQAMTDEERTELSVKPWWLTIVTASRIRAMERAEEEALGRPRKGLADTYDSLILPGEHAARAILRTFEALYSQPSN